MTGKLCKWCCQHQDINKAKDRAMWLQAQVSGHPKAFYRITLIYKRLTVTIFEPAGLGDGAILETCDASACMTDPSDLDVSAVVGCGSCSR